MAGIKHKDIARLYQVEKDFEWDKWENLIPLISWPDGWLVKAIPPFGGAIVRYIIQTPTYPRVSVYLDGYDLLGYFGEPYWEVYPHKGDVFRCALYDVDSLLEAIGEAK